MPQNITQYNLFVASPGDVKEEREMLEEVIKEINLNTARHLNIVLQLTKWETHSYPDFGADAQDVINKQINDEYDIFLGIMYGRFGTPTGRAESGTYEEFQRAYLKWQQNPKALTIMFYFKQGLIDITKIDPEQLKKVIHFQNELKEKGALYRTFEDSQQFAQLLRSHLTNVLHDFNSKNQNLNIVKADEAIVTTQSGEADQEIGMYESIDLTLEKFNESVLSLTQMTSYTSDLTAKMNSRTKSLNRLAGASIEVQQRETRRICDLLAGDYLDYCTRTNTELPIYSLRFSEAMKYLSNAYDIYTKWQEKDESGIVESYTFLRGSIETTREQTLGFKISLEGIPGLTTKLIKAKKEILQTLDKVDSEFNFSIQLIDEVIKK